MASFADWDEFVSFVKGSSGVAEHHPQWNVASFKVEHTTSTIKNAQTDAYFKLVVIPKDQNALTLLFPNLPDIDERERGRTDRYTLPLTNPVSVLDVYYGQDIAMMVQDPKAKRDRNAWLPTRFRVTADLIGPHDVVLVDRAWPDTRWFSGDTDEDKLPVSGATSRTGWNLYG